MSCLDVSDHCCAPCWLQRSGSFWSQLQWNCSSASDGSSCGVRNMVLTRFLALVQKLPVLAGQESNACHAVPCALPRSLTSLVLYGFRFASSHQDPYIKLVFLIRSPNGLRWSPLMDEMLVMRDPQIACIHSLYVLMFLHIFSWLVVHWFLGVCLIAWVALCRLSHLPRCVASKETVLVRLQRCRLPLRKFTH